MVTCMEVTMEILYIKLISKELILTPSLAAVQCLTTLCWHVARLWCCVFQFGVFGGEKKPKNFQENKFSNAPVAHRWGYVIVQQFCLWRSESLADAILCTCLHFGNVTSAGAEALACVALGGGCRSNVRPWMTYSDLNDFKAQLLKVRNVEISRMMLKVLSLD